MTIYIFFNVIRRHESTKEGERGGRTGLPFHIACAVRVGHSESKICGAWGIREGVLWHFSGSDPVGR